MRAGQPNTGGEGPITSSYASRQTHNYLTVAGGDIYNKKVADHEENVMKGFEENLSDEELLEREQKTSEYKRNMKNSQNSYSSYNSVRVFNKTGKKKGTLYTVRGKRLMAAQVK